MPSFNLDAVINPTINDRAVDREVSDMQQSFEDGIGDVGIEGLGGARATGAAGGGGAAGAAGGAGILGKLGGTATKAALPVALAGATAFGILQATQRLAQASPALQQTLGLFGDAMDLFFRPFGNALAETFRPWASQALTMAQNFNELASSDGLRVAVSESLSGTGGGGSPMFPVVPEISPAGLFDMLGFGGFAEELRNFEEDFEDAGGVVAGFTLPDVDKMWSDLGGWPDVSGLFPGWPNISGLWPGWPAIGSMWPGWPSIDAEWPGWPDISLPTDFWPEVEWPGWDEIISTVRQGGGENREFKPGSGGGTGADFTGTGPSRGRGVIGSDDPRLPGNDIASEEELRRNRQVNERIADIMQSIANGQTDTEELDAFMSGT